MVGEILASRLSPRAAPRFLCAATAIQQGWSKAMKNTMRILACSAASILLGAAANAEPLTTTRQIGSAILACWESPAGITNSSVTLNFSLKRDGSLIGPPRATAINVSGNEQARKQFIAAAEDALNRCTPVELAPALANGIAGRIFTMQFGTADRNPTLIPGN